MKLIKLLLKSVVTLVMICMVITFIPANVEASRSYGGRRNGSSSSSESGGTSSSTGGHSNGTTGSYSSNGFSCSYTSLIEWAKENENSLEPAVGSITVRGAQSFKSIKTDVSWLHIVSYNNSLITFSADVNYSESRRDGKIVIEYITASGIEGSQTASFVQESVGNKFIINSFPQEAVSKLGGKINLAFYSTKDWNISITNPSGVSINDVECSKPYGKRGDNSVEITLPANYSTESRIFTIYLTDSSQTREAKKIEINQNGFEKKLTIKSEPNTSFSGIKNSFSFYAACDYVWELNVYYNPSNIKLIKKETGNKGYHNVDLSTLLYLPGEETRIYYLTIHPQGTYNKETEYKQWKLTQKSNNGSDSGASKPSNEVPKYFDIKKSDFRDLKGTGLEYSCSVPAKADNDGYYIDYSITFDAPLLWECYTNDKNTDNMAIFLTSKTEGDAGKDKTVTFSIYNNEDATKKYSTIKFRLIDLDSLSSIDIIVKVVQDAAN